MKKLLYISLLLMLGNLYAQTIDTSCAKNMREAKAYLLGYGKSYNPSKSFQLFMQCAENGNARAMNAIGNMYMQGLGTDTNKTAAFNWFKKAAEAGYPQGWYNLGMMYKYGNATEQDLEKACECYHKASELGYAGGYYAEGYMLYKGLGCNQDYEKAFGLFKKGADNGRASCMYFLGLCYRNGYGVERDTIEATYWLKKAADEGYDYAYDELAASYPENKVKNTLKSAREGQEPDNLPQTYRQIKHNARPTARYIDGSYSGYLVKYDYSGKNIVHQVSLSLNIISDGNIVTGTWIESDTLAATITGKLTDTALVFTDAVFRRTDHYNLTNPLTWLFNQAIIEIVKTDSAVFLAGNIQMYTPDFMEPNKPMYISLKSSEINNNSRKKKDEDITGMLTYPNPFTKGLNVRFTLLTEGDVYAEVLSIDGTKVHCQKFAQMPIGTHTLEFLLSVPAGTYVVKLTCNDSSLTSIVVKQ